MVIIIKVIKESVLQALRELANNKLRSFLTLLGISIGIFCIIGVQAAMNSLEDNVRKSFEKLGDDVVYLDRFNWGEDPSKNWWKYIRRPQPDYGDYQAIRERSKLANYSSYYAFIGASTIKYRSSSVERAFVLGVTYDYKDIFKIEFDRGRYFSTSEYQNGVPKALIGYEVAANLFGSIDPIGRNIKFMGRKLEVIGVIEKSGEDLISIINYDEAVIVNFNLAKQLANLKAGSGASGGVAVKAHQNVEVDELKDELTWIVRAGRRLKPIQESDFALNTLSLISKALDGFFGVLNTVGLIIGIFAIIVGAVSVANIMFVSVKERTNIIGIKKAIGAKNFVILLEFLVESVILCIIGGLIGLVLVYFATDLISKLVAFEIFLSLENVLWGLVWSIGIGVVSGFIPALKASLMNPVDAIRSK